MLLHIMIKEFKSIRVRISLTAPCQLQPITKLLYLLHHFHAVSFIVGKVIPVLWGVSVRTVRWTLNKSATSAGVEVWNKNEPCTWSWASVSPSWWPSSGFLSLSWPAGRPAWPPLPPSPSANGLPPSQPAGPVEHTRTWTLTRHFSYCITLSAGVSNKEGDRMMTFVNDTHSLFLLLLSLLGISFSFLLRLLPGFFFLFEFLNSRVTAVGRICENKANKISSAEIYRTQHHVTDWFSSLPFVLLCVLRLYQLVFVFCSSPLSSSEPSKLDSAFQSISSHLDCKGEKNMSQSNIWATQELNCVAG